MTTDRERVTPELSPLRYPLGHEGDLLDALAPALRLCRAQIRADHCAACAAAASFADVCLAQIGAEGEPA